MQWALEHQDAAEELDDASGRGSWLDAGQGCAAALPRRIRDRRRAAPAGLAPLAIFPLCAEDVVDILMGLVDYTVTVRLDKFLPAFRAHRIAVSLANGRDAEKVFLRANRGTHEVVMPALIREAMLHELTQLQTVVQTVDQLLRGLAAGWPDAERIVVCDESRAWPIPPVYLAA